MLPAFSPYLVSPVMLRAMTVAIIFLIVVIAIRLGVGRTLFGGRFTARPLLNYSEQKLFGYLQRRIQSDFGSGIPAEIVARTKHMGLWRGEFELPWEWRRKH